MSLRLEVKLLSHATLSQRLFLIAEKIHTLFNDYALVVATGSDANHIPGIHRQQLIRIPLLKDIISLFGLETGINWKYQALGPKSSAETDNQEIKGLLHQETIGGFDVHGIRVLGGELREDASSQQPGIDYFESWRRKTEGTALHLILRRYTPDGSKILFVLGYEEPIEVGSRYRASFLSYWDFSEPIGIYYHIPFFQVEDGDPIFSFVQVTEDEINNGPNEQQHPDVVAFLNEVIADTTYNGMRANVLLGGRALHDRLPLLSLYRIDETARYLESEYRYSRGITEMLYKDYVDRLSYLRRQVWLPLGRSAILQRQKAAELEARRYSTTRSLRSFQDLRPLRELYPKGLGPLDPGPHNPSSPGDPRGPDPRGPDPRGPDPRGPR